YRSYLSLSSHYNVHFEEIFAALTFTQQNNIVREYGLQNNYPILDQLQFE
ncbi:555_t:CDS:1, partial [Funneliformis geosporum]